MLNLFIAMLAVAAAGSIEAATAEATDVAPTEAPATEQLSATADSQKPAAKPEKKCRMIRDGTGSRVANSKRLCLTAEGWKKYYAE